MRSVIAFVVCATTAAHADAPDDAGPIPSHHLMWELGVGPSAGIFEMGTGHAYSAVGARLHGGLELGRWAVLGRIDGYDVESSCARGCAVVDNNSGHAYRLGADLQFAALQVAEQATTRGGRDVYELLQLALDVGIGGEAIKTDTVPERARPDLAFGISFALRNGERHPWYAPSFALRFGGELARAFDAELATPGGIARATPRFDGAFIVGLDVMLGS